MAKKAAELTAAQKHVLDIRQKIEVATKANTDKPTDATKKHLAELQAALKTGVGVENRERFVRVVGGRVKKSRLATRNIANISPRSLVYDETDVVKMEAALLDEVKKCVSKMRLMLAKPTAAKADDDFTF